MSNVKIMNITSGTFAVFLLASSMASADTNYPASDFQPKVVYQDPDYKPAQTTAETSPVTDSKYPAANFQPKVLYNDPSYQHSQSSTAAGTGALQKSVSESTSAAPADAEKKEESSSNYLIGLVVLALVGVVLFRKKSSSETRETKAGHGAGSGGSSGMTGVAKYVNRISGTGVSRYLEKQVKSATASSAATGVAKYMVKQAETAKTEATEAKTGVEKYMRNRG
ncbi:MAG: hypothetical protein ACXWUD_00855 [Methylosarcina sp.]